MSATRPASRVAFWVSKQKFGRTPHVGKSRQAVLSPALLTYGRDDGLTQWIRQEIMRNRTEFKKIEWNGR